MADKHPYLTLFLRSLAISATTVGGGYVILSVLRRLYVDRLGRLTEEEMLDLSAVAQSAPGAVAVNASLLVGYRLMGTGGALCSLAGTVIPPVAAMCLLAGGYRLLEGNPLAEKLFQGMRAGAAAVILDTALTLTKSALTENPLPRALLFAGALGLCLFTKISAAWIVLGAAAVGAVRGVLALRRGKAGGTR